MNGFAPLIEGFLAFALTMLALTMGVSAIVGALHHLRRWHARGLRDMVRLLYAREIVPLLEVSKPSVDVAAGPTIEFTTTSDGIPVAREHLGDAGRTAASAAGQRSTEAGGASLSQRAEFIYDMTFMPVPDVVEKLVSRGPDYWRNKLVSAERLCGYPWYTTVFHPRRVGRRWVTLGYSLANLKDDEFRERLAASDVGKLLKDGRAWTSRGLKNWEELVAYLWKQFEVLGGASSETFARHSRGWSVAVGFFLALFLNIDSLDLLNSYLTNPALRQQVIARSEEIQSQRAPAPASGESTLASARAGLAAASTQFNQTAEGLGQALETFTSTLSTEDSQRFAKTVQTNLQNVVAQAKEIQSGVGVLDGEVTEAERTIRGVTQSLTASFPIGWKRFPNCGPASADLRCQRPTALPAPEPAGPQTSESQWPMMATVSRWTTVLATASAADPDGFNQWLIGVLLTGLLLGLGTPFWVQAVTGLGSLRPRWDSKKEPENKTSSAGAAGGSKAGAGAPQGA
jgi:hypothetical protein